MNTPSELPARKRNEAWLLALIVAFLLGFLLAWWLLRQQPIAKSSCPQAGASRSTPAQQAQAGGGAMHGGGAPGQGSPAKLNGAGKGPGDVQPGGAAAPAGGGAPAGGAGNGSGKVDGSGGSFDVNSKTTLSGPPGTAGDGNASSDTSPGGDGGNGNMQFPAVSGSAAGDLAAKMAGGKSNFKGSPGSGGIDGGGDGEMKPTGGTQPHLPSSASVQDPAGNGPVRPMHGGALSSGSRVSDGTGLGSDKPADKVVTARDYRYDTSGLPRYPNAIKVASGTDAATAAAAAGPNIKDFSVTEIITDDPPDVAVAWYHDHLPVGWNEIQMPSASAVDQAIQQAKAPAANKDPVSAMLDTFIVGPQLQQSKPGVDAARAAGLTIFQPANQDTDRRTIMVLKDSKSGKTGILLMEKADKP